MAVEPTVNMQKRKLRPSQWVHPRRRASGLLTQGQTLLCLQRRLLTQGQGPGMLLVTSSFWCEMPGEQEALPLCPTLSLTGVGKAG